MKQTKSQGMDEDEKAPEKIGKEKKERINKGLTRQEKKFHSLSATLWLLLEYRVYHLGVARINDVYLQ